MLEQDDPRKAPVQWAYVRLTLTPAYNKKMDKAIRLCNQIQNLSYGGRPYRTERRRSFIYRSENTRLLKGEKYEVLC